MRIGLTRSLLALCAIVGLACSDLAAQSTPYQSYPLQPRSTSGSPSGPVQALFTTPAGGPMGGAQQGPFIDAQGNPVIIPASYSMGCATPCASGSACGCYGGCPSPYPGVENVPLNAYGLDQCGPHYFDCRAEAVYLTRDETFGQDINFTTLNVQGDVVLSSGQLGYQYEPGFRILGRYDVGPLSLVEFGYMGIFNWHDEASFTDPDPVDVDTGNLFSLFSNFGITPAGVQIEGGPMPQTERSITQSIAIDSELQTAEFSYRRYWVGYSPRISGTLLAGFRYTKLKENFLFHAEGEGTFDNFLRADNDLAGFQTGGDVWVGLLQGLRVGSEAKAGIYNNHFDLRDVIFANPTIEDAENFRFRGDRVAFIGEASVDIVADILPSWSLRAGYEVLFLNTIVLAGENFNTGSPFGLPGQTPREPILNEQGNALYYGYHAGLEYVW